MNPEIKLKSLKDKLFEQAAEEAKKAEKAKKAQKPKKVEKLGGKKKK